MNPQGALILLIPAILAIPLLVYHFLMFPNLDGVAQDLSWYNYDGESGHFLYWFGFWFMGGLTMYGIASKLKN